MKYCLSIIVLLLFVSCNSTNTKTNTLSEENSIRHSSKEEQEKIIQEHLKEGVWTKGLYSIAWQEEIDKGLAKDSTIAYLWQQKAMPLYKQCKYELAKKYIDQAVKYDRDQHQDYRAFMSCIFSKRYTEAIADFEDCIKRRGNSYVMDHSYYFYIALSKLQLNEFAEAESILKTDIQRQKESQGEDWVHYLDYYYLGVAEYEQGKNEEAGESFDKVLKLYSEFAEALYYKGNCLNHLGQKDEAIAIRRQAMENGKKGYSFNEDNSIYERYPYQMRWELYQ